MRVLLDLCLVGEIGLHGIVQLQHVVVVGRAQALGDVQPLQQGRRHGPGPRRGGQEALRHLLERGAQLPYARRIMGMDVAKHAQDALALRGRGGETVDVQARIVLAPGRGAAGDFHGAKTGAALLQLRQVGGQQAGQQAARLLRVAVHQRRQQGRVARLALAAHAAHGVPADVLGIARRRAVEQRILGFLQVEAQTRQQDHLPVFQRLPYRGLLCRVATAIPLFDGDFNKLAHGQNARKESGLSVCAGAARRPLR